MAIFAGGPTELKGIISTSLKAGPKGKAKGNIEGWGEQNSLFPVGPVSVFCYTSQHKK